MTVRETILASLSLLSKRDRRKLLAVALVQMATAFLDLIGILLIGVVSALSLAAVSGSPTPAAVQRVLQELGWADVDMMVLAVDLAVVAGVLLITKTVVNIYLSRRVLLFLARRQAEVAANLCASLLTQPLLQLQERSSQQTAYALTTGVNFVTIVVLGQGVIAVSEIALLAVLGVGLLAVSPVVTLFTVTFFAFIAFVLQRVLSGWAGRLGKQFTEAEVGGYSAVQEALRAYRELVVMGRRPAYVRRFSGLREQAALAQANINVMLLIPKYVFEMALIFGGGILAVSQFLTKDATAAVAVIAIYLAAGTRVVPSMLRLQTATILVRGASQQGAPTFELARSLGFGSDHGHVGPSADLDENAEYLKARLSGHQPPLALDLNVREVSLTYPGTERPAVDDVSVALAAGKSLALVGPSGSGKSTLADLLLGILAPDAGEVRLGGRAPLALLSEFPGAVAYVPQTVAIVDGTVRDNVTLGLARNAYEDGWVWEALDGASLGEYLRTQPQGLDLQVGEGGVQLSGGQRQRLGIARALFARPSLLVMDEATSALDASTEDAIAQTLRALEGHVTTVTIAHRLATIRECDHVVYLEGGSLVAQGTFDEVRSQAPGFDAQASLLGL